MFKKGDKVVAIDVWNLVWHGDLERDRVYTVAADEGRLGPEYIDLEMPPHSHWHHNGKGFLARRFKLAAPAVEYVVVDRPAVVGDKVQINPEKAGPVSRKYIGIMMTAVLVDDRYIRATEDVGGVEHSFFTGKWQVLEAKSAGNQGKEEPEEEQLPFAPGCLVVCVDAEGSSTLAKKGRYTVKRLYDDGTVSLHGFSTRYHTRRFKVVEAAPDAPRDIRQILFEANKNLGECLCSYGVMLADGETILNTNDVCHARIRTGYGSASNKDIVAMAYGFRHQLKYFRSKEIKEEHHLFYADYILNRSPWAGGFITKDVKEAVEKDILMNVEWNINQLAGACVALRCVLENTHRPALFHKLVKEGINEHVAWIAACGYSPIEGGEGYQFEAWGGGHDVLDKHRSLDGLMTFFHKGYFIDQFLKCKPYREENAVNYRIADPCAPFCDKASIWVWLYQNTEKAMQGEGFYKKTRITEENMLKAVKALEQVFINWKEAK